MILYKINGKAALFSPSGRSQRTLEEMAARVVPEGQPWRAVTAADLPTESIDRWDVSADLMTISIRPEPAAPAAPPTIEGRLAALEAEIAALASLGGEIDGG